ncbi:MAG TPA: CpsD/CapB family tyrosine-protein kinase [Blastocatellia bacterium]|nr:CpsD/CapB family tyrosine-protein kinase [Blastocatellia bacterium]
MGKVYKALTKLESEQPQGSLAATVVAGEEARAKANGDQIVDDFDFIRYSLNTPSAEELEQTQHEAGNNSFAHGRALRPAREITLDVSRIDPHLVTFYDFDPRAAEEYSKMAITLISSVAEQPIKRVLIASAQHGEGRTCVALNLACALAQAKQRVLVVDTDLRSPSLLRLLGAESDVGIAEALTRELPANAAAIEIEPYGFAVLPMRERMENSAEILASPAFRSMLNSFEPDYDFMLFDSSPLLESNDANLLMKLTNATVMVIRPGKTSAGQISKAIAPLAEDNILGVVLNRAD